MKIAQTMIAGICLAAFSNTSVAVETWHTSTLKYVYALADGGFVLIFNVSAPSCTSTASDKYFHVIPSQNGMTVEGAKKIYGAALMAMATDKAMQFAFDDATSNCYINRAMVVN
jgi:hypothetical protein